MLTYDPMNIEMYNIHMDLYSAAEGVLLEIGNYLDIELNERNKDRLGLHISI